MNKNLVEIVYNCYKDNGKLVNKLLENNIITIEQLINIAVVESENFRCVYNIAKYVKNAPIDKLADIIIQSKSAYNIYIFANIENAPIEKLVDALIELKESEYVYKWIMALDQKNNIHNNIMDKLLTFICDDSRPDFPSYISRIARYSNNLNIEKFVDAIIKTDDADEIDKFADTLLSPNRERLTSNIINKLYERLITLKAYEHIIYFVDMFDLPVERAQSIIIDSKNAKYIYEFARDIENADIDKLTYAICQSNDAKYIYEFTCDVIDADINKLTDAICESNNAEYIYYFARDVENADIDKLTNAILKTKDIEQIISFIENIPNINLEKFKEYSSSLKLGKRKVLITAIEDKEEKTLKDNLLTLLKSDDLEALKYFSKELKTIFAKEEKPNNESVRKMTLKLQTYNENKAN